MARFWGGPADGEICAAYDKPITKQPLVIDGIASTLSDKKPVQFHVRCFPFWDTEEARTEVVASSRWLPESHARTV